MTTELFDIVKQNNHFEFLENGKIHCKLTNHDINPDLQKFNEYINKLNNRIILQIQSKGYQKAIEKNFDFEQYRPHIVPFKGAEDNNKSYSFNQRHFLWCHLTKTKVPKMRNVILRHVEGKKYQRLIQLFNKKKQAREERKKITLMKCKKVTFEEEDDKFDGVFIDRMIMELEEDEKLNDNDLDGDESYSDDIYDSINKNYIQEEYKNKQRELSKKNKKEGQNNKMDQDEDDDEEMEDDEDEMGDDEEFDSQEDDLSEEELEEDEEEESAEEEYKEANEKQRKEHNQKGQNKFQPNSKKMQENVKIHQDNKQGPNKKIKKQKFNPHKKFNKFQKK